MSNLNTYQSKVRGLNFVLVLCFTALTTSIISITFSADVVIGSKKTGSLSTPYCNGATYSWTWMSGNKTIDENGVYDVPDMAYYPGARDRPVSWTDTDGNLWLFGGIGLPESGSWGYLNDLWRFTITSKEWTWISGNKTTNQNGVYGTKGVPDRANYPGGRKGSVSWRDTYGDLWLFGGDGLPESGLINGYLNDLWRFSITSKEWTWISGNKTINQNGVYGTEEVPDRANYPGGREDSVSWTDTDENLWLFGGLGYNESGDFGQLNDLWRFTITSKKWTWISGNKTTDENGVYGTKEAPDSANYPGGRKGSVSWTDMDENLWLFGGDGYPESGGSGYLNDLWRFSITSKEWAWMSGKKTINQNGIYGTKGVPDVANYPGGRYNPVSGTDMDGNLWLFGGLGYSGFGSGYLNDLWRFNITSKEWAWMSGNKTTNQNGVYGTKGVPDKANYPGARYFSVSWTGTDGNLWLFGGHAYDDLGDFGWLNDLWRFKLGSSGVSQPYGQIPSTDDDDGGGDNGEESFNPIILFIILLGILGVGVIYYQKKHSKR